MKSDWVVTFLPFQNNRTKQLDSILNKTGSEL